MEARKTHYLISTHQIPGVFNSPFNMQACAKEIELRNARPLSHRDQRLSKSQVPLHAVEILNQTRNAKGLVTHSRLEPLPPISVTSSIKVQVCVNLKIVTLKALLNLCLKVVLRAPVKGSVNSCIKTALCPCLKALLSPCFKLRDPVLRLC